MTSSKVLAALQEMNSRQKELNGRQNYFNKPIGVDTLMLALKMSATELMPLIEELKSYGAIEYHEAKATKIAHIRKLGSVSIT
jgi:hypothetical protein